MILDFDDLDPGSRFEADICLIGAGVAGLSIAREFLNTNRKVLVIESGGRKDEIQTQRLYQSDVIGLPHDGVHNGRFRVFGGSSTRWGAQLMTYEDIDFESRTYVPESGWPLAYDEMAAYYNRAQAVLSVNDDSYEEDFWEIPGITPLPFDRELLHYRFSKWAAFRNRNLARTIGPDIEKSDQIDVLLHANLTEIKLTENGSSVDELYIRSLAGHEGKVAARQFILCSGAIENARLLLASNSVAPNGVGNDHDLVGRYFQDHVSVRVARLYPDDRKRFTETFDPFLRGGVLHSCKVAMTPSAQRQFGCVNVMGHVVYGFTEESGLYELRKILRAVQSKRNPMPSPMGAWRILRYSNDAFRMVFGQFLARRRLSPRLAKCHLDIECEQAPSPDSRVTLSDKRDATGMQRVKLDWKITDTEKATVKKYCELFAAEWDRLELGRVSWEPNLFEDDDKWNAVCRDTYHHAGTTRMHDDPGHGVVDTDLKVHGISNLYIGSTSVFPTSGCANPTLTMMALCLRLADQLKRGTEAS